MTRTIHTSRDRAFPDVGNGIEPCCMGSAAPPVLAGVAYRADGRPADVCAGLTAMRAAGGVA